MKILPNESVKYLRPYSCSSKSDCSKCSAHGRDCHFPNPYNATNRELSSVPYVTEIWPLTDAPLMHVGHDKCIVVTFDELLDSFNKWNQCDDESLDANEHYTDVYDWMRDAIDNGIHPCTIIE